MFCGKGFLCDEYFCWKHSQPSAFCFLQGRYLVLVIIEAYVTTIKETMYLLLTFKFFRLNLKSDSFQLQIHSNKFQIIDY